MIGLSEVAPTIMVVCAPCPCGAPCGVRFHGRVAHEAVDIMWLEFPGNEPDRYVNTEDVYDAGGPSCDEMCCWFEGAPGFPLPPEWMR